MYRSFLLSVIATLLIGVTFAQVPLRVVTRPKVPTTETLERLGLTFGWYAKIPLNGPRDGIYSIQVIPRDLDAEFRSAVPSLRGGAGRSKIKATAGENLKTEIVVQTNAGVVHLFDGETGTLRWSTPVGIPFSLMHPVAFNSQSLIMTRREFFYVINRKTGVQQVYTKRLGDRDYGVRLEVVPSAAPAADDEMLVFSAFDRVVAFYLPDFEGIAQAREKSPEVLAQERYGSIQPELAWVYFDSHLRIETPPLLSSVLVAVASTNGRLLSLERYERRLRHEVPLRGGIGAPLAQNGRWGYVGSLDYFVYAVDLENERLGWRFPAGAPVVRAPHVNNEDLFVFAQDRGLFRLDRRVGRDYWLNSKAERFLSAHYFKDDKGKFKIDPQDRVLAKYVYTTDRYGRLLILDGDRGSVLAQYDTSAWTMPVVNEWTDRLYLGNDDGQILCVHPRASRLPQINKTLPRRVEKKEPGASIPAPMPMEKKEMEEKKDEEKKEEKMGRMNWRDRHTTPVTLGWHFAGPPLRTHFLRDRSDTLV